MHDEFKGIGLEDVSKFMNDKPVIVDVRGMFDGEEAKRKEKDFITNEYDKKIPKSRAIIALSLLLILFLLCAYHQTNHEYHREYPSLKDIVANYEKYIGETISISGEVVGVHSATFQLLEREDGENTIFVVLPNSNIDVGVGDKVEVLGTLGPDYQISAEKMIVSKRWKHEFAYIRSFIALIFLIFVFMRNWKFNIKRMEFVRSG